MELPREALCEKALTHRTGAPSVDDGDQLRKDVTSSPAASIERYFVHIPASEFGTTKPLAGWQSIPGNGVDDQIDDHLPGGENGIDALEPDFTGISSAVFELVTDGEPVNGGPEQGAYTFLDDADDDNGDMTIDFGFFISVSVGNLVYIDGNQNGRADAGEGAPDLEVEIYADGALGLMNPVDMLFDRCCRALSRFPMTSIPACFCIHIPASQFMLGAPLYQYASSAGVSMGDDDTGEDGIDETQPMVYGVVSHTFTLLSAGGPVGAAESGQGGADDDEADSLGDMTIDLGFVTQVCVGNLVFHDLRQ